MKLGFEIDMVSKTDFPKNHTKILSKNIIMPLNNLMIPYEIFFLIKRFSMQSIIFERK